MTRETARELNLFVIAFFGFSLVAYLLMNGGAYWRIARYYLFLHSPFAATELKEGEILEVTPQDAPVAASSTAAQTAPPARLADGGYTLVIPKIEVSVPIVIPRDDTKKGILASLEEGVGLYPGSVEPGENGRIIILGHSSRASWYRGDYATIFALLEKLENFDIFYVSGPGYKYTYQVMNTQFLSPQATNDLMATIPVDSEIDLVTCYPVGSASKRTVVQAKLIQTEQI